MNKITKKTYHIERKETVVYTFMVDAKTKKEALMLVNEHEVEYDGMYGINTFKAKISHIETFEQCPNKGRAWSEIPIKEIEIDGDKVPRRTTGRLDSNSSISFWHYNGACTGEKNTKDGLCYHCRYSMSKGMRFTLPAENAYLNERYGMELIE